MTPIVITGAGVAVGFLSLTITVILLASKMGRLIGRFEAILELMAKDVRNNAGDINKLWDHQRIQDTAMGQCSVELRDTKKMVTDIHDHFLGKGLKS